jgi:subtilisin family serine protease
MRQFAVTTIGIIALLSSVAPVLGRDSIAKVDAEVLRGVANSKTASFWVVLGRHADLSAASGIADRTARGQFVVDALAKTANTAQAGLRRMLTAQNARYQPFWITNAILVSGGSKLVRAIAALDEVARIAAPTTLRVPELTPSKEGQPDGSQINAVEYGISNIGAPAVWSAGFKGAGIVVANIDTGVQFDHPALVTHYRGNAGGGSFNHNFTWYDPAVICPSPAPCDNNGHGSHTMGTMVGDDGVGNQIGVAPAAKWIAAKGCESTTCSDTSLINSGQWMLAPCPLGVAPGAVSCDVTRRPDVVNNSWGGGSGDFWYADVVQAWSASGIMPVFSIGNSGPSCGTANTPGDYGDSYAVGAHDVNNVIARFSSRGFTTAKTIKPNISAPGVNVRSSVPTNSFASFSGTSMAAPHLAGAVALLWNASPYLRNNIDMTRLILDSSAVDMNDTTCGGTIAKNNVFGEGRLNIAAAVTASKNSLGGLTGKVVKAGTSTPVVGATVKMAGPTTRTTVTDTAGQYKFYNVPVGNYNVSTSAQGYSAQTVAKAIVANTSQVQNIGITPVCDAKGTLSEKFDSVAVPNLPVGWTAANAAGAAPLWQTSNSGTPVPVADSAPNAAWIDDPAAVSDKTLTSPAFVVRSNQAQLRFRHRVSLESRYDGGVLELKIGAAPFQDVLAAGATFLEGGYNDTLLSGSGNPLSGRPAWTGEVGWSTGYATVIVALPASAGAQTVQARWRMGSDSADSGVGWRIDSVAVIDCFARDGSGTMSVAPSTVVHSSTGNTLTFTYTVPNTGGMGNGRIQLIAPAGWSAPSIVNTNPGKVTSSVGVVSVLGQTITIDGISRSRGQIVTIVYGSKASGGPGATAPAAVGAQTWQASQRSTASGTLTNLGASPVVNVT